MSRTGRRTIAAIVTVVAAIGAGLVGVTPAGAANPWERLAAPSPSADENALTSVSCGSETLCTAVGVYLTENETPVPLVLRTQNGTRWRRMTLPKRATPHVDQLTAVDCSSGGCTAAGRSYTLVPADSNDPTSPLVARWVGLVLVSTPTGGFQRRQLLGFDQDWFVTDVTCPPAGACTLVGGAGDRALIVEVNGFGTTRRTFPLPGVRSALQAVHCVTKRNCTAVGHYYASRAASARARTLVMHTEDGVHWAQIPTPNPAPSKSDSVLTDVSCVRNSLTCTAVGYVFPSPGAIDRAFILRTTDSVTWTRAATPTATEPVRLFGVSCFSTTECTAVGAHGAEQSSTTVLLRTTDGTTWSSPSPVSEKAGRLPLDVDCPSPVRCVAVGTFYAAIPAGPTVRRSLVLRET